MKSNKKKPSVFITSSGSGRASEITDVCLKTHLSWMDEIWTTMSPCEKLSVLLPYRDDAGRGVLSCASRTGDTVLIKKLLLTPGINFNMRDVYGNTALHHAVLCKHEEALRLLLSTKEIDTTIANHSGATAFEILTAFTPQSFSHDSRMLCFARMILDNAVLQGVANKMLSSSSRQNESKLDATIESITNNVREAWEASEFGSEILPLYRLGDELFIRSLFIHRHKGLFSY